MNPATSHNPSPDHSGPWQGVVRQLDAALQQMGVHPARVVVLVPYAQLMNEARSAWAAHGLLAGKTALFVPRFESTQNWASSMRDAPSASADDISQDAALDALTAASLLQKAGLAGQSPALVARLVDCAWSLARVAAAHSPADRVAWGAAAAQELGRGLESPYLALELAIGQVALAWATSSNYPTDVLFSSRPEALVVVQGLQNDPLAQALQKHNAAAMTLTFAAPQITAAPLLHPTLDAEDEAQCAAACVLAHLALGRSPVALIAQDRLLTRRVSALLAARGVLLRDETGWTLSTTRAAATLMGFLRALPADAATDAVLDWLKNAPAFSPGLSPDASSNSAQGEVALLEAALRKDSTRVWRDAALGAAGAAGAAGLTCKVQALRDCLQATRPLADWLRDVRLGLQAAGQWAHLALDAAGKAVLAALYLEESRAALLTGCGEGSGQGSAQGSALGGVDAHGSVNAQAGRNPNMRLEDFTRWAMQALESGSFSPEHPASAQVVILPLSQLLGRTFAAVVLPGCDEHRLAVSPEPPGQWSPRQRLLLGLPLRADLAATQRAAWRVALSQPHLDVLWRQSGGGEHLMPSGFVQELLLDSSHKIAENQSQNLRLDALNTPLNSPRNTPLNSPRNDPRVMRIVPAQPTRRPQPVGALLLGMQPALSATAYEDLRRCPYRFFALRLLRVQEADELEGELGKRDFGNWLHAALHIFHEALKPLEAQDIRAQAAMLNIAAEQARCDLLLSASEFLPFAAIWPNVRDGYLAWLAKHEASGARYSAGEVWKSVRLGTVELNGKLDRIDVMPDGSHVVMDYKTEALEKTKQRIKSGQEDTQLAFYAALLPDDTLAAAYVNLGEKSKTETLHQKAVVDLRDDLINGILSDMTRIENSAVLPALGEGAACDFCAARGLCRKDFWTV